jgi:DNA (cytosine-5)-methyltransferase 1
MKKKNDCTAVSAIAPILEEMKEIKRELQEMKREIESVEAVEPLEAVESVESIDFSKKNKEELKTFCRENRIKGYTGKKNEDIIKLIHIALASKHKVSNEIVDEHKVSNEIVDEHKVSNKFKFIDLFCGIGGFHQAMVAFGGKCVLACDIDKNCRDVYEKNYGIKPHIDVTKLDTATIPDFDVLCGGFPCQAFSHSGKQLGFEDTRGTLFRDIARILKDKQPKYFLLENVKNLKGHNNGKTWKVIYNALVEVGYVTYDTPVVISPHMLGIPQHRQRVLILGYRKDIAPIKLNTLPTLMPLKNLHISSIFDTTPVSEEYNLSSSDRIVLEKWEEFVQYFKTLNIKLPTFPLWSDYWDSTDSFLNEPIWKKKVIKHNQEFYKTHISFLEHWLSSARTIKSFNGAKRKFEWQCGEFQPHHSIWKLLIQFRPSGIRVKNTNYSPALVAMAQIVYVGEKGRKLTVTEIARLQSFPENFIFPSSKTIAYKQFGNAVNVDVIKWAVKILFSV